MSRIISQSRPSASQQKSYDYLLKFLLVGDSDVGKQEILSGLEDGSQESPFCGSSVFRDTSGQGRFSTIIRSYSRGAQGIILVYDITNKWSFDGIDRWLQEVEEHAPGIPKILIGNRLHLAFKRQVGETVAEIYARKNNMVFLEVSPLCNYNITESFVELSRMALLRNGMERVWRSNRVLSLHELCCRAIVARTTVYSIEQLPLPLALKSCLKSYSMTTYKPRPHIMNTRDKSLKKSNPLHPCDSLTLQCRKSCTIS
ncbi:ras-related protein Rab-40C-like [Centruroides sculpturatus]|uniref:ras-related protein Rab-40C-like n=1 Tax=Centruroides sculpturatus TaxID=218467 RepID=UPI000C6CE4DB|nr:ras-related protein Rab-40C-like [Centruroides sculpturatus]